MPQPKRETIKEVYCDRLEVLDCAEMILGEETSTYTFMEIRSFYFTVAEKLNARVQGMCHTSTYNSKPCAVDKRLICQKIPNFGRLAVDVESEAEILSIACLHVVSVSLAATMVESNDLLRFETDLEFLQSLANPQYLNCILSCVCRLSCSSRSKQVL